MTSKELIEELDKQIHEDAKRILETRKKKEWKMNHQSLWSVALKTLVLFTIVGGVLLLSSCARNCNTIEYLGDSLCR